MQFWNSTSGGTEIKFLSANDLLVESDSANAETITSTLVKELNQCNLSVGKLNGLCTDGASVMTGKTSGVATRLKELNTLSAFTASAINCHLLAVTLMMRSHTCKKLRDGFSRPGNFLKIPPNDLQHI